MKKYEEPIIDIIECEVDDVILTSVTTDDNPFGFNDPDEVL